MIISASRRTDIPAFFSKWFINRVREEYLFIKNPFNANHIKRVSLSPDNIDAIVFWTRNPKPLIPYLNELDDKGYSYYFQFTITGYPRELEQNTPHPAKAIETFIELSDKIGKEKVIWRYDPIILSKYTNVDEHIRLFDKISRSLEGKTDKVVISFADFYKKLTKNLEEIEFKNILEDKQELHRLVENFTNIAKLRNLLMETCAEVIDLDFYDIAHGKCIDDELIKTLFGLNLNLNKDENQREECGCIKSLDIGSYNTCAHGCSYCYATFSKTTVQKNKEKHNPNSPFLVGNIDDLNYEQIKNINNQKTLF